MERKKYQNLGGDTSAGPSTDDEGSDHPGGVKEASTQKGEIYKTPKTKPGKG